MNLKLYSKDPHGMVPGVTKAGNQYCVPVNCFPHLKSLSDFDIRLSLESNPLFKSFVPKLLTHYQVEGLGYAYDRSGFSFWWAPGSGKTLGALVWSMMISPKPRKTLFVTRAAAKQTIYTQVYQYTNCTASMLDGQSVDGPDVQAVNKAKLESDFLIIGYEVLPYWSSALVAAGFTNIVFDESHRAKSYKRTVKAYSPTGEVEYRTADNIASACAKLSKFAQRRLCTTATPIRDRPRDLWAQLDLAEPNCWGTSYQFVMRYCDARPTEWGGLDTTGASNQEELKARIDVSSHSVSYLVTHRELPAKRRSLVLVPASELSSSRGAISKNDAISNAISDLPRLKNPRVTRVHEELMITAHRKRRFITQLIKQNLEDKQKVLVFTGLVKDSKYIAEAIGKLKVPNAKVWEGTGETSTTERMKIRDEYMAFDPEVVGAGCALVGTGDAWGESINLQDTDVLHLVMLPFTPGQIQQWEGRVSRLGQKRPVLINYLIAEHTIDERLSAILLSKLPACDNLIDTDAMVGLESTLLPEVTDEELSKDLLSILLDTESVDD